MIKRSVIIICLLIILSIFIQPFKKERELHLFFEDKFNGTALNKRKWNVELKVFGRTDDFHHNESYQNYISPDDVIVNDGLYLRSRKTGENSYSSGIISSHEKFVFRYGYIEILAKYPTGNGVWPAFWLMPQDQTWPPEIDIAEYYGGKKLMHTGLCYGDFPHVYWDSDAYSSDQIEGIYSTYGLWWTEKELVWYHNGRAVKTVKGKNVPQKPMYIILSNGVSNKFGPAGIVDDEKKFPNFLEVKYVRVYSFL